jgi:hypothetical protein
MSPKHNMTANPSLPFQVKIEGQKLQTSLRLSVLDRLDAYLARVEIKKAKVVHDALDEYLSKCGA